jgi:hypothetical protein
MLRFIGVMIFTFVTYRLLHDSGIYPGGLGWAILYGLCVPPFLGMFVSKK